MSGQPPHIAPPSHKRLMESTPGLSPRRDIVGTPVRTFLPAVGHGGAVRCLAARAHTDPRRPLRSSSTAATAPGSSALLHAVTPRLRKRLPCPPAAADAPPADGGPREGESYPLREALDYNSQNAPRTAMSGRNYMSRHALRGGGRAG